MTDGINDGIQELITKVSECIFKEGIMSYGQKFLLQNKYTLKAPGKK